MTQSSSASSKIGTPLPSLEKSKDTGEFVPIWKQEASQTMYLITSHLTNWFLSQVRDEKGRRRLHGAFTGGFSAGYFNTVGSKEGTWSIGYMRRITSCLKPLLSRMDSINIRLLAFRQSEEESSSSRRLYGRGRLSGDTRQPETCWLDR